MVKGSPFGQQSESFRQISEIIEDPSSVLYFIGIGGVSMYSLARLSLSFGKKVRGSDREDSRRIRELVLLGAKINIGHSGENVKGASLVIYSHAIAEDNPEILKAAELNIPIVSRAEFLGTVMLRYTARIGVSGSHGKSTTVAMLDCIFSRAGRNPTTLSGADLSIGEPFRIGGNSLLIYEACEYKDSFLSFSPTNALALNLELDHPDYFENIDMLKASFAKSFSKPDCIPIINGDDSDLREIAESLGKKYISFGSGENNDYQYSITSFRDVGYEFSISRFGSVIGSFELNIPGVFNINNATAAIITAIEQGIEIDTVKEAISSFRGIGGRLEYIGNRLGRPVFLDYAHHPTEIAASLNALGELLGDAVTVVFMPHTYSRTKALWNEFISSLSIADYVVLCDIFAAREREIEGISSERLALDIGPKAKYCSDEELIYYLDLQTGGAIVLMGAGNFEKIKNSILKGS